MLFTKENSNIRFDGKQDKVQVFDPYKNVWRDWQSSGKIILPSTITVTTSSLDGEAVTATIEDESYTTTFVNGVAVFKVYSAGTVTITCGEYSTSVEVTREIESLEATLEAVIWIKKDGEYMNGSSVVNHNINTTINCSEVIGKDVYAESTSYCRFRVYSGNYNETRELNANTLTRICTVTNSYTSTLNFQIYNSDYSSGNPSIIKNLYID